MHEFDELVKVTDHLLGPQGCPWDREQTLESTRAGVMEEVCELIEAIDLKDAHHIKEELGDLMFNAIFLCRLAEQEGVCNMKEVLHEVKEKLVRRHPHVWGDAKIDTSEELLQQWDSIKQNEKGKTHRKSALDGIPVGLPALSRAYKSLKKMTKAGYSDVPKVNAELSFKDEQVLGDKLLELVIQAQQAGLDPEQALRAKLAHLEREFRKFEAKG